MQGNRTIRVREAGEAIEEILASDQNQEAWKHITSWQSQASEGQAIPLREHLDRIATERAEMYRCRPPEGIQVPIMVMPVAVEDGIPE